MDPITQTQPAQQPIASVPEQQSEQPLNGVANKKSMYLIVGIVILVLIMIALSFLLILRNNTTPSPLAKETKNQTTLVTPTAAPESVQDSSSLLEQAETVNTGDATIDITELQNDASTL